MARKAIQSVDTSKEEAKAKAGKQDIKSLPAVFVNEEHFRSYVSLASLLIDENKVDEYNETLKVNKLLSVKQSVANYKANGIELEQEFYPAAVNIGGLYCGINRRQRVIFAVGFIGSDKIAVTISTRANKVLPELSGQSDNYGYSPKYLARLEANSGTLLPSTIDFNHFVANNWGLPYCYSTAKADLLDYAQWLNSPAAYEQYKTAAEEFERINYYNEDCVAQFTDCAKRNGFVLFKHDVMKVAIDFAAYLHTVIGGENFTTVQKAKAIALLKMRKNEASKADKETQKTA